MNFLVKTMLFLYVVVFFQMPLSFAKNKIPSNCKFLFSEDSDTDDLKINMQKLKKWLSKGNIDKAHLDQIFKLILEERRLTATKYLLQAGAKPNITNDIGETVLHIAAVKMDNENIIRFFLNQKVDPNKKDKDGDTPLHIAVRYLHLKSAKTLIEMGSDPSIQNKNNKTPIDLSHEIEDLRDKKIKPQFIKLFESISKN